MPVKALSVIIPARNEQFLSRTIDSVFAAAEMDTEVIAVLDGAWPDPPLQDNPHVTLIHHTTSIGQRAATNEAVRLSTAKFVMKLDAHCAVDKGFDRKLIETYEPNWTVVPMMWNLHAFDLKCKSCSETFYQQPVPSECSKCKSRDGFDQVVIWAPRRRRHTVSWRFDSTLHFQYWHNASQVEVKPNVIETMSFIGACWFTSRERYWELEGLDESHGSWGQVGTEIACKSWLSGGKLVTNKNTWFAHMFRSQFGFPYELSGNSQERARIYSRGLWFNNRWPKQKYHLRWLVDKFWPIPGWTEEERNKLL